MRLGLVIVGVALAGSFWVGVGRADETPTPAPEETLVQKLAKNTYILANEKVAMNNDATQGIAALNERIRKILSSYELSRVMADSAPQATQVATQSTVDLLSLAIAQNQRIIEQNDKIIALLQKIADKK